MSAFYCFLCDRPRDADFDGCQTDPEDHTQMICEDCYVKYLEEHPEYPKEGKL